MSYVPFQTAKGTTSRKTANGGHRSRRQEVQRLDQIIYDSRSGSLGGANTMQKSASSNFSNLPTPMSSMKGDANTNRTYATGQFRKSASEMLQTLPRDFGDLSMPNGAGGGGDPLRASWYKSTDKAFQSIGVEFEVALSEALTLCVPGGGDAVKPTAPRTAACFKLMQAFAELSGPRDSQLRQQFQLVLDETRHSIYSHAVTATGTVDAPEARVDRSSVPLERVPYHDLSQKLEVQVAEMEEQIESLGKALKAANEKIEHLGTQNQVEVNRGKQHEFMAGLEDSKKQHLKRKIEVFEKEGQSAEKEYEKLDHQLRESLKNNIAMKNAYDLEREAGEKLKGKYNTLDEKYRLQKARLERFELQAAKAKQARGAQ
jgi:hypothetical protein